MKIISRTTTQPINGNQTVVPNAPIFEIINTGNVMMYVDQIPFFPGERFGVDSSIGLLIGMISEKDIDIREMTEYAITFGGEVVDTILYGNQPVIRAALRTTNYSKQ